MSGGGGRKVKKRRREKREGVGFFRILYFLGVLSEAFSVEDPERGRMLEKKEQKKGEKMEEFSILSSRRANAERGGGNQKKAIERGLIRKGLISTLQFSGRD